MLKLYSVVKLVCGGGVVKKVWTVIITVDKHLESSGVIWSHRSLCMSKDKSRNSSGVSLIMGLWKAQCVCTHGPMPCTLYTNDCINC